MIPSKETAQASAKELADNFKIVGNDFINLHHKLVNENNHYRVDFSKLMIEESACGTVACHGGWGAWLYLGMHLSPLSVYGKGAQAIAKKLGFDPKDDCLYSFLQWANENPSIWGNRDSLLMFTGSGYLAFGKTIKDDVTLQDIGNWYIAVATRIANKLGE